jgi:ribosomal protein S6--L-glutamate ligase
MGYKIGFFKKPQGVFTKEFINEIENDLRDKQGVKVISGLDYKDMYLKNGKVFFQGKDLSDLDVYFWHDVIGAKIWKGDNYHINVLKALANSCAIVNSPESTRIVNDKYFSHLCLSKEGLPVAEFALVNATNKQALLECFESFGGEILIKPRFRGFGTGIVRVSSKQQFLETIELLQCYSALGEEQFLLEKYYENDLEKWISVVVLGEKVLFGYRKKLLGDSDWKIYDPERKDARGQFTDYVEPTEELKNLALKAKRAIDKDIICFDFIYTKEGYKIIDENGRPGLYDHCLERAGIDIKRELVNLIISKLPTDNK